MKKAAIACLTFMMIFVSGVLAYAADSDIGETPEIQFSSDAAKDLRDKAAELAGPVKIYEYLRNNAEYALYHGSRSGSINSFMGLRGSDVDLASALISMYRSRGIHSRYAVGTVRVAADEVMNWLGVKNLDLAVSIMKDQGIQNVALAADRTYVDFEHVWVEALIPYGNYRGAGPEAITVNCGTEPDKCRWVSLDPSFKQKQYNTQSIDIYNNVSFDYTSYYNAIKNNDSKFKDKNPVEIYENQILEYLRINYPGKSLEDVADSGRIVVQENLILPASLPYTVVGTPRRYNSVADHDAVVPVSEPKKWGKKMSLRFDYTVTMSGGGTLSLSAGAGPVLLAELATKRLTLTTEFGAGGIPSVVVRLGGNEIARPISGDGTISGYTPAIGDPFTLTVNMDGSPAPTATGQDHTISAAYPGMIGGYYLLATGGESSNWSQVHRAAQELLDANKQYKIVFNPSEAGCQADGINCTPYVDANNNDWDASDPKLLDNKPALDALTGGMLYVAAMQYYTKLREGVARLDALNNVKTPISGFLGVVSSTHEVEYINGTSFSVLPGGLLIDMKGIQLNGVWRIDQPEVYSNKQFELVGHLGSSLEHEIWQELTGYDAVSTVRGIQFALANGATLLNPKKNTTIDTLPELYGSFGFSSTAPSPFQLRERIIYNTKPASWYHPSPVYPATAYFDIMKKTLSGTTDPRSAIWRYGNTFWDSNLDYFATHQSQYTVQYFNSYWGVGTGGMFDYLDENQGFVPSQFVYRTYPPASTMYSTEFIGTIRNNLYKHDINQYWVEYLIPSTQTIGSTYRFTVDIRKQYETSSSNLASLGFEIQNTSLSAGGGYVDGSQPLRQALVPVTTSNVLPTFTNAVFTDQNTIAQVNNDVVKTPSTVDPVSTVTGNNYHDETDLTIKGRGLNIALTRTYNSAPSSTKTNGPFGYGWTHSYSMKLKSNDYGICPNCSASQKPENVTNKTSSITYTDERGGEHNYLVNESTLAITAPAGEFDSMQFDSPSAGYHTITFRNGVKYIFQGPSDLKSVPGREALLSRIEDPYGNYLSFAYNINNLTGITDTLGRTVTIGYAGNHINEISDWTGRKWQYGYDASGNLTSVTNPLNKTIQYTYHSGTYNLNEVILPETRDGKQVKTAFKYYQNGKTFNYANSLDHTEALDYDLYRRSTRVTDPRGFVRQYDYDENGLMTRLEEPDRAILLFENSPDGLRFKKYDGLGYATTYSYRTDRAFSGASDTNGNVTLEKDPLANTVEYDYGIYDQATRTKDKNGNVQTMAYYTTSDSASGAVAGKLQSVTLSTLNGTANILVQTYTYNPDGTVRQLVEYIDPANPSRKRITDYVYQDNGLNLQSVVVSGSGQTVQSTFTYDTLGRRKTATLWRRTSPSDATLIGLTTTYDYDALDRVTRVTDSLGNIMETIYDGNGKIYQVKGYYKKPDSTYDTRIISTRQYDAAERMVSDTDIYGNATRYTYDEAGNVIQVTDAEGHTLRYEYDAMNRRSAVIDANGHRAETVYDLAGHPVRIINPLGKTVKTDYDALGRPTTVTDALGYQTTFGYDANGNVTTITDANANAGLQPKNTYNATQYTEYDELNRVKREVDALNGETKYTYDLLGNITSITDAENRTTHFDYNDLGQLVTVRDPLIETPTDKVTTFTYDEAGNVLTRTKRSGATASYFHDTLNRLTQAHYNSTAGSITETTGYDIHGNKQSAANADVTYTYEYDLKNRPTKKTDSRVNKSLTYTYDKAGNIHTKTNYDGSTTEYRYDSANKLVAERNADYLEVSYQYDGAGRLLNRILSNGAKTSYTWDDGNRLTNLTNTSANGSLVSRSSYTRDRLGNITSAVNLDQQLNGDITTTYSYDPLYRLVEHYDSTGSSSKRQYIYDKVGNRIEEWHNPDSPDAWFGIDYTHDAGNRLLEGHSFTYDSDGYSSYRYDDDGNLITKTWQWMSPGSAPEFRYNAKGQLKEFTRDISYNTTVTDTFAYDPYDYRIFKHDSKGDHTYLLEGEHLEATMTGSQWEAKYLRGAVIDEIVNGFTKNSTGKWTNYTYHHDALQSVMGLSGHEGSLLAHYKYQPFGLTGSTSDPTGNQLYYTGRDKDDTGYGWGDELYYYRARYYTPGVGRFISEDPKGFEAGVNFYAYALNNPINFNDPYGLIDSSILKNAGAGVPVVLPNGSKIPGWKTGSVMSPLSDLSDVAAAGRNTGSNYSTMLNNPDAAAGAILYLGVKLGLDLGHAGTFDYQRSGSMLGGYTQYRQFRDVSNVNVGLYAQQAGLTLDETLTIAGSFATLFSSNANSNQPYGLDPRTAYYTGVGHFIGSSGVFDPSSQPSQNLTSGSGNLNVEVIGFDMPSIGSSANGGFVIYPNKANTNMMRAVYAK